MGARPPHRVRPRLRGSVARPRALVHAAARVPWARSSNYSGRLEFELDLLPLQISRFFPHFESLVLGCIDANFCKQMLNARWKAFD